MSAPARTTGWPSIPKILVHGIADRFGCYVATRFPGPQNPQGDLQQIVRRGTAVVRVVRIGGNRDDVTDYARIAVDVVEATEARAEDLAENIATWLIDDTAISTPAVPGAVLDRITVEIAPHVAPYTDPTIAQFSATYVVTARRFA